MSLQPDSGAKALFKSFFTFGAMQIALWVVAGTAIWFLSRWISLWVLAAGIVLIVVAMLVLGNPQDPKKRADMLKDIESPK
jgi:hypothetical protein